MTRGHETGLAVIPSRYGDACGGAEWLAFCVSDAADLPQSPWGDDNQCVAFFNHEGGIRAAFRTCYHQAYEERRRWFDDDGRPLFGMGATPVEAREDLLRRCPQAAWIAKHLTSPQSGA